MEKIVNIINEKITIKEHLVSVAIPTYNRLEGLRQAIECFCEQTYRNIEIIISDNCSQHDPTEMVMEYVKMDTRIKYYRQNENIGMTLNSDFILKKSTGKYFILGSDDDWWEREFISELVALLSKNDNAVCALSDFIEVDQNNNKIISGSRLAETRKFFGFKIHQYPEHYPLLKEFESADKSDRLKKFIIQKEYDGKANVHRSLCERQVFVDSIEKLYQLGLKGCWAFDQLLAFTILTKGPLVVSKNKLFKCTVGNIKNYTDNRSRIEYLEGYVKIVEDCYESASKKELINEINKRYFDKTVGFYQEYYSILNKFTKVAIINRNKLSMTSLKDVYSFVHSGDHYNAALIAKKYINDVNESYDCDVFEVIKAMVFSNFIKSPESSLVYDIMQLIKYK